VNKTGLRFRPFLPMGIYPTVPYSKCIAWTGCLFVKWKEQIWGWRLTRKLHFFECY